MSSTDQAYSGPTETNVRGQVISHPYGPLDKGPIIETRLMGLDSPRGYGTGKTRYLEAICAIPTGGGACRAWKTTVLLHKASRYASSMEEAHRYAARALLHRNLSSIPSMPYSTLATVEVPDPNEKRNPSDSRRNQQVYVHQILTPTHT